MKAIEHLEERLRNEMVNRMDNCDIEDILEVLECAEQEIERLTQIIVSNNLPLNPCEDCGKEEQNPGLEVCGQCYHKRITNNY